MSVAQNTRFHAFIHSLCKRTARCMWSVDGPKMAPSNHKSKIEAWIIAGRPGILIVHAYPDDHGFDLYVNDGLVPPDDLAGIEAWLGPTERCPSCDSTNPTRHPAVQAGGEVRLCSDVWHASTPEGRAMLAQAAAPAKPREHCGNCGIALDVGGGCGRCKPGKPLADIHGAR